MTFACHNCNRNSRYVNSQRETEWVMEMMTIDRPETRTYICEKCGVANRITLRKSDWSLIDYVSS